MNKLELLAQANLEGKRCPPILLEIDINVAMGLIGLVQTALRHPNMHQIKGAHHAGLAFVDSMKESLKDYPAIVQLIELGEDPKHDFSMKDHIDSQPQG